MEIPMGFPEVPFPADNTFTTERWELGKKLFFDTRLSIDESISCASCHLPEKAFSDIVAKSIGSEGKIGRRNSPSLANVAYHPYYTREGGLATLEMQILVPIQEHDEFNHNIVVISEILNEDPEYRMMAEQAYNREIDPFVITRSISCFERSLISGNSAFDQYFFRHIDDAMSDQELRGMNLFFGNRTQCSECHGGFNFTNYAFENNGIYKDYPDSGRFRLTGNTSDIAKFKVPSLRNIALTGPYMHDGSMSSLEEVVEHYNNGGEKHFNQSDKIRPLGLTQQEQEDLISFLHSLTDQSFIQNPVFKK